MKNTSENQSFIQSQWLQSIKQDTNLSALPRNNKNCFNVYPIDIYIISNFVFNLQTTKFQSIVYIYAL